MRIKPTPQNLCSTPPGRRQRPTAEQTNSILGILPGVFFIGVILAPWIAKLLITRQPRQ